jgi:RNA polymerase sigma-70 factor (ECF subfamily)
VPDGPNDGELVQRIGEGDTEALRTLYERYGTIVFGMALRLVGDRQAAEECTQDAFVAVWRNARSYEPERAAVSTWMISIARNRAVDLVRRRQARPFEPRAEIEQGDQSPDVAELVSAAETSGRIASAMAELPDSQRDVLILAYFHGLSHSEIAGRLNVPLGTVKGRIRLALDRLRTVAPAYALDRGSEA